jgi:hypothetical protein
MTFTQSDDTRQIVQHSSLLLVGASTQWYGPHLDSRKDQVLSMGVFSPLRHGAIW